MEWQLGAAAAPVLFSFRILVCYACLIDIFLICVPMRNHHVKYSLYFILCEERRLILNAKN